MPKNQTDELLDSFMKMSDAFHHLKEEKDEKKKIFSAFLLGATYTALELIRVEAKDNPRSNYIDLSYFNYVADTVLGCSFQSFETEIFKLVNVNESEKTIL